MAAWIGGLTALGAFAVVGLIYAGEEVPFVLYLIYAAIALIGAIAGSGWAFVTHESTRAPNVYDMSKP